MRLNAPQRGRTCRHFGISRRAFYKWKQRYDAYGEVGLYDRSRTPRHSPRATPREVVSKILYLRQHYHFGPARIAAYLKRFHRLTVAPSSVHRLLSKHGMNRLPANQKHRAHAKRWKRYEKARPGQRLQVDVKFLERIPGTQKTLLSVHRHRRLQPGFGSSKVYDACNQRGGDPLHRRGPAAAPVPRPRGANGQWGRVPVSLPLAPRRSRHPPRLYPPTNASPERQGRALTSGRRPRVLPVARPGRHHRRYSPLQHEAARVGGLLQLPSSAWCPRWTDTLRTASRQDEELECHRCSWTVQREGHVSLHQERTAPALVSPALACLINSPG